MPSAFMDTSGDARVPRDYFATARKDGSNDSAPQVIYFEELAVMQWKYPPDWQGFSKIGIWFYGYETDASFDMTVVINGGANGEAYNNHSESHALTPAITAGQYTYVELSVTYATVLALLTATDLIRVTVFNDEEKYIYVCGLEVLES